MTNHHNRLGHLSGVLLAAAIISAHPCTVFSQDVGSQFPSTLRPQNDSSSAPDQTKKHAKLADDALLATLPDAPMPQNQDQAQAPPPSPSISGKHVNKYPVLPPGVTRTPLTFRDKFRIYEHKTFGPPAVILPAFGAGLGMINPPSKYPKEWKDGAGAFGRNYGYRLADRTSRETAQFLTGTLLHEDPRYLRSTSTNPFARTLHALAFTVLDKTDSGRTTFVTSNFA